MNQFKFKYDQMKENQSDGEQSSSLSGDINVNYETESSARNVCFVLNDSKRFFINYAYLISGEYEDDPETILLVFTTHTIKLSGMRLASLFYEFMEHLPRQIKSVDQRYIQLDTSDNFLVTEIEILQKE